MNVAARTRFTDLAVAWSAAVAAMLAVGVVLGQLVGSAWPSSAWGSLASSTMTLTPLALGAGLAGCFVAVRREVRVGPLDVLGAGLVALPLSLAAFCALTA